MMLPSLTSFTIRGFGGEAGDVNSALLHIGASLEERSGDGDRNLGEEARFPIPAPRNSQSAESRVIQQAISR